MREPRASKLALAVFSVLNKSNIQNSARKLISNRRNSYNSCEG
jgi:hypothetical protein